MLTLTSQPARGLLLPLLAACTLPACGLFAGPATSVATDSKDKNVAQKVLDDITPLNQLETEFSYVGDGSFKEKEFDGSGAARQRSFKRQSETEESFEYAHRFPLFGRVYLKLGADYERFDFTNASSPTKRGAPLPSSLQNISGVVAVEYIVKGQAAAFISSKPGVYYSDFNSIRVGAFDAPTNIGTIIPINSKLYVLAGVRVSLLAKYPAFPIGGVVWLISDNLKLEAVPPEPRLIYSVNQNLDVFAGGEILGESYKRDDQSSPRNQFHRFDGAVIDYTEYRAGAGISFKPSKQVSLDLSGGWDLGRTFDYYRGDSPKEFKTGGAPYGKIALSAAF